MGHVVEIGEVLIHWRRERGEWEGKVGEGMDGEVNEWVGGEWNEWGGGRGRDNE